MYTVFCLKTIYIRGRGSGADMVVYRTFLCEGVTAFIRESLGSPLYDDSHKYDHIGIVEQFLFQL